VFMCFKMRRQYAKPTGDTQANEGCHIAGSFDFLSEIV
jgi:hypothetical protein